MTTVHLSAPRLASPADRAQWRERARRNYAGYAPSSLLVRSTSCLAREVRAEVDSWCPPGGAACADRAGSACGIVTVHGKQVDATETTARRG